MENVDYHHPVSPRILGNLTRTIPQNSPKLLRSNEPLVSDRVDDTTMKDTDPKVSAEFDFHRSLKELYKTRFEPPPKAAFKLAIAAA